MKFTLPMFFRRKILRKILAVFFAVLIWLAVYNQIHQTTQIFRNLTVAVINDVQSPLRLERERIEASVKIQGRAAVLQSLTRRDVLPFVDISDIEKPGTYKRQIRVRIKKDAEVRVVGTTPAIVSLRVIRPSPGQ